MVAKATDAAEILRQEELQAAQKTASLKAPTASETATFSAMSGKRGTSQTKPPATVAGRNDQKSSGLADLNDPSPKRAPMKSMLAAAQGESPLGRLKEAIDPLSDMAQTYADMKNQQLSAQSQQLQTMQSFQSSLTLPST